MSALQDTNYAEEHLLVSALQREFEHCVTMRGRVERHLASGDERFVKPAAMYEVQLATIDSLLAKLPTWFRQAVAS